MAERFLPWLPCAFMLACTEPLSTPSPPTTVRVLSLSPPAGSVLAERATLRLVFSEEMDARSIQAGTHVSSSKGAVAASVSYANKIVTVSLEGLSRGTTAELTVDGVRSVGGGGLDRPFRATFKTAPWWASTPWPERSFTNGPVVFAWSSLVIEPRFDVEVEGPEGRTFAPAVVERRYALDGAPGAAYRARVRTADEAIGEGAWSEWSERVLVDTTPPGRVRGMPLARFATSSVAVEWRAGEDRESGISGYLLSARGGDGRVAEISWTTQTATVLAGSHRATRELVLTAVNGAGLEGPPTSLGLVTFDQTPPSTPEAPRASADVALFEWSEAKDDVSGIDHYVVEVGSAPGLSDILVATSSEHEMASGFFALGPVYGRVAAVNGAGLMGAFSRWGALALETNSTQVTADPFSAAPFVRFDWARSLGVEYTLDVRCRLGPSERTWELRSVTEPRIFSAQHDERCAARVAPWDETLQVPLAAYSVWSQPTHVDLTPPSVVTDIEVQHLSLPDWVGWTWSAAVDPESGIAQYFVTVSEDEVLRYAMVTEEPYFAIQSEVTDATLALTIVVLAINGAGTWGPQSEAFAAFARDPDAIAVVVHHPGGEPFLPGDDIRIGFAAPVSESAVEAAFRLVDANGAEPRYGYAFLWEIPRRFVRIAPNTQAPESVTNADVLVERGRYTLYLTPGNTGVEPVTYAFAVASTAPPTSPERQVISWHDLEQSGELHLRFDQSVDTQAAEFAVTSAQFREHESLTPIVVAEVQSSNGLVTVTTARAHRFATGQAVCLSEMSDPPANACGTITSVMAPQRFQLWIPEVPTLDAAGPGKVSQTKQRFTFRWPSPSELVLSYPFSLYGRALDVLTLDYSLFGAQLERSSQWVIHNDAETPSDPLTLVSFTPADGGLAFPNTAIELFFSRPLDAVPDIRVMMDGVAAQTTPSLHFDFVERLRLSPLTPWPAGAVIEVMVPAQTQDVFGRTLDESAVFSFTIADAHPTTRVRHVAPPDEAVVPELTELQVDFWGQGSQEPGASSFPLGMEAVRVEDLLAPGWLVRGFEPQPRVPGQVGVFVAGANLPDRRLGVVDVLAADGTAQVTYSGGPAPRVGQLVYVRSSPDLALWGQVCNALIDSGNVFHMPAAVDGRWTDGEILSSVHELRATFSPEGNVTDLYGRSIAPFAWDFVVHAPEPASPNLCDPPILVDRHLTAYVDDLTGLTARAVVGRENSVIVELPIMHPTGGVLTVSVAGAARETQVSIAAHALQTHWFLPDSVGVPGGSLLLVGDVRDWQSVTVQFEDDHGPTYWIPIFVWPRSTTPIATIGDATIGNHRVELTAPLTVTWTDATAASGDEFSLQMEPFSQSLGYHTAQIGLGGVRIGWPAQALTIPSLAIDGGIHTVVLSRVRAHLGAVFPVAVASIWTTDHANEDSVLLDATDNARARGTYRGVVTGVVSLSSIVSPLRVDVDGETTVAISPPLGMLLGSSYLYSYQSGRMEWHTEYWGLDYDGIIAGGLLAMRAKERASVLILGTQTTAVPFGSALLGSWIGVGWERRAAIWAAAVQRLTVGLPNGFAFQSGSDAAVPGTWALGAAGAITATVGGAQFSSHATGAPGQEQMMGVADPLGSLVAQAYFVGRPQTTRDWYAKRAGLPVSMTLVRIELGVELETHFGELVLHADYFEFYDDGATKLGPLTWQADHLTLDDLVLWPTTAGFLFGASEDESLMMIAVPVE